MRFPEPPTYEQTFQDIDDVGQAIAEAVEEQRRSERRWRIATFIVALLALGVSTGSLIVALVW